MVYIHSTHVTTWTCAVYMYARKPIHRLLSKSAEAPEARPENCSIVKKTLLKTTYLRINKNKNILLNINGNLPIPLVYTVPNIYT